MTGSLPRSALARLGWGPALRIALRELRRAPGRTLLVVVMVLLPVTAVVALDTLLRTGEVDVVEALPRDLGDAQARLDVQSASGPVLQDPDGSFSDGGASGPAGAPPTADDLLAALPDGTRLLAVRHPFERVGVRTAQGRVVQVEPVGADLSDPRTRGPYRLLRGQAPDAPDEVAVTPGVERAGFPVGSTMLLPGGTPVTVTGTVRSPRAYGSPRDVVGDPGALGLTDRPVTQYYAHGPDVTWDDVLELNALGAVVLSRAVVLDPPSPDRVPELLASGGVSDTFLAVVGLVVVVAVLEVVLLAGPAFAVGARRQRRALALLAAGGGEPRHLRRVVLSQGLLVGVGCALLGGPLGIALAAAARGPLTTWTGAVWGPFDVSARDVALVCLLGGVTALLAALLPAVLAAREPVLAGLRGQRRAPAAPWRTAVPGVLLFAVGCLLCAASLSQDSPEALVGWSAVPTVLGAVLLAPLLLRLTGRLAGRLPLAARFAVRDAERQRGRTAPAVAAVAATVAGVVALATGVSSDAAEQRAGWGPAGPVGAAVVSVEDHSDLRGSGAVDLVQLAGLARDALPGEQVAVLRGLLLDSGGSGPYEVVHVCRPEAPAAAGCDGPALGLAAGARGVLVGQAALEALAPALSPPSLAAARTALRQGGAAVSGVGVPREAELRHQRQAVEADGVERAVLLEAVRTTAVPLLGRDGSPAPAQAVLSEAVARRLGEVAPVALVVGDGLDGDQEQRLRAALLGQDERVLVEVERGPGAGSRTAVLLLGLAAGALALGGSLAATSLALAESRPDLATLGAVGARPRTRRAVAASYAFVLALTGALLGVAAGAVPGLAGAVAVTRAGTYAGTYAGDASLSAAPEPDLLRFVDVPWLLLLGLVVLLPLLSAAVAGLSVRSRLPAERRAGA